MVFILSLLLAMLGNPSNLGNQPKAILQTNGPGVNGVAFSPDGRLIAVACENDVVELWNVSARRRWASLRKHTGRVKSVAFNSDGTMLACGSNYGTIRLWDIPACKVKAILKGNEGCVSSVAFSPNGKLLASGGGSATVILWNVPVGKVEARLKGSTNGSDAAFENAVNSVAFSSDGKLLASGGTDGIIRLWNLAIGTGIATHVGSVNAPVSSVAFSPDGTLLAASSRFDCWDERGPQPIKVWCVSSGKLKASFKGHNLSVSSIAFSPDGKLLVSVSGDGLGDEGWEEPPEPSFEIKLWDLVTQREMATLSGETGQMLTVAFSPNGKLLATGDWTNRAFPEDGPGRVRLWDVRGLLSGK